MAEVQNGIKGAVITIKIVGIGGGGNNVLRRLAQDGFDRNQLLAINTDVRQLKLLEAEGIPCLLVGAATTRGRGTGGNVEKAQNAAIADKEEIAKAVAGSDLVFLTAGMGKGVGTGAAPVVAKIAHDMGILTVGMVTLPFTHEGSRKMDTAKAGVELLRQNMDALVVVNNDNIEKLPEFRRITVGETFSMVDEVLRQSIGSIVEMIETTGVVNVDFADVKTIFTQGSTSEAIMGTSVGRTALEAVQNAINSPLIEISVRGARGIIVNITGNSSLALDAVREANIFLCENTHPDVNNIFGLVVDESMGSQVRATIIATDFDPKVLLEMKNQIKPIAFTGQEPPKPSLYGDKPPVTRGTLFGNTAERKTGLGARPQAASKQEADDVDVPEFMRRKNPAPLMFGRRDKD
ncbi:cell division protein FtsZ [Anaerovibrio sp.]|uniref:cell division protein FtsZ n=1 Tax=Anaerovibrio sp. TaxID=1872532 RepID=UPI003F168E7D